jgi:hypothetical protein
MYIDNDGIAGISAFIEDLLSKFDVRTKPITSTKRETEA